MNQRRILSVPSPMDSSTETVNINMSENVTLSGLINLNGYITMTKCSAPHVFLEKFLI